LTLSPALRSTLDHDHFMNAERAREWRLIDRVLSTRGEAELLLSAPAAKSR
jgi:ATP-dependent protease ClpP protease subunit